jgi:plastocyanin
MGARFSFAVILVFGLAVVAGVAAARSQSQTVAGPPTPISTPTPFPTPGASHINIAADPSRAPAGQYQPVVYTAHVGQKLTWTNLAGGDHTATADNGAFNTDVLQSGKSASWTPRKPGTYPYSCFIHPDMRGTVIVQP